MSIDARVQSVHIFEDGSGELRLVDRPGGCAGQSVLTFASAPEEVTALSGRDIWGGARTIVLGDCAIADRIGINRIRFYGREQLLAALIADK